MEDALISPEGFMILSGAGLIEASKPGQMIYQHVSETIDISNVKMTTGGFLQIDTTYKPYLPGDGHGNMAYVMLVKNGEIVSEPYIPLQGLEEGAENQPTNEELHGNALYVMTHDCYDEPGKGPEGHNYVVDQVYANEGKINLAAFDSVIVDYYVEHEGDGTMQIEITPEKFGGNYYLEASTLFRDQNGVDMPAEFIIPNCKIQSNFTFTMASSGDPSTQIVWVAQRER